MEYVFYFDESFHDRKIVIAEDVTINTLRQNTIDGLKHFRHTFGSEYSTDTEAVDGLTRAVFR